ncbi:hypothetical protein KP509_14G057900 [Ceratopteris richardii]|uniref:Uncharacterized protein n=1 Tax=Ceratopteris richardii TaxID=49495 RepID=A0A8T2TF94_CERRI|nr:hypothetical protein KP509_14G057900 [Ceratopteris richardii]
MGKFLLLASQIVTQKKSLETGADQFHLSAPKSLSRERSHMSERRDVERALRRHRKRLARIVVDQWLFKARTRLLVLRLRKIVQKHWKLCCFKALKEFTASNVLKHEKQKAALNFSIIWRKRQYFKAWFTFCKLQCRQSEKTLRLSKSVRRRVCSMFLHIWLQRMQQQIEMQRKTNVAERFWMLSLLSASFMHWQLGLIIIKRKKKINKLALGYWAHKRLSSSFSTLKKAVALKCMILALTAKRDLRLVRCFFNYWHSISKEDMKELEKQAVCAVHKRLLLKSFDTLQNYTSKRNSARHLNQIAICFHHDQCMYCTYRAWRNYVILRKNTRKMAAAALTHMNRRLMVNIGLQNVPACIWLVHCRKM